jgi:hypothetical protein
MVTEIFCCLALSAAAGDITAADLVAGYWQNQRAFRTLRVQLRVEEQEHENWRVLWSMQADEAAKRAHLPGINTAERLQAERDAQALRRAAQDRGPKRSYQDFWTDWQQFQQRVPCQATASEDGGMAGEYRDIPPIWTFPEVPLTAGSVAGEFSEYWILSFGRRSGFRAWDGRRNRGTVGPAPTAWTLPPLCGALAVPGPRNVMDEFFALDAEKMEVVGKATVAGNETYVLEYKELMPQERWLPPNEIKEYGDRAKLYHVTRAYVDLNQGCLPLKMDWSAHSFLDGKRVPRKPLGPFRVLDGVEIERIEEGGYYPIKGVIREYGSDHTWKGRRPNLAELAAGAEVPPVVLNQEKRWEVLKIEANIPMPDEMFALPFPQDTLYLDSTAGKLYVTGSAQRVLDGAVVGEAKPYQPPASAYNPPPRRSKGWFWGGMALVLAVVAWIAYQRVRSGRQRRAET